MKRVEARDPRTWIRYDPKNCFGCRAGCCTLPVKVDAEDLFHMGYLRFDQVNGPLKRIAQRLIREGIVRRFHESSRTFTLVQRRGGDCVFLGADRLCTIYDRRPQVCRRFPENSARPGFCPGCPVGKTFKKPYSSTAR